MNKKEIISMRIDNVDERHFYEISSSFSMR